MDSDASSSVILNPMSVGGVHGPEIYPMTQGQQQQQHQHHHQHPASDVNDSSSVSSCQAATAVPKPNSQQQFNFNTLPHSTNGWQPDGPMAAAAPGPSIYTSMSHEDFGEGSYRSESIAPPPPSMHPDPQIMRFSTVGRHSGGRFHGFHQVSQQSKLHLPYQPWLMLDNFLFSTFFFKIVATWPSQQRWPRLSAHE